MIDKLHSKAQALADAWLKHRDDNRVPTDQQERAFCLMIDLTLARQVESAELQACILQAAGTWDHAIAAGEYLQSVMAAERAAHPHFEAVLYGAMDKSADTVRKQNQLARIGRDLDALQAWIDRI